MKNQYFGDIGDFGKYGLLRFLNDAGISLGINWYLTVDDESTDGRFTQYLSEGAYFKYDPELYRHLKQYVLLDETRDVTLFENSGLLSDAVFYHDLLSIDWDSEKTARELSREAWHKKAVLALKGQALVFLDPDNGLRGSAPRAIKDGTKYAYTWEAADYYEEGADLFYYCHKGRRTAEQWAGAKGLLKKALPECRMLGVTFHKGTQRSFLFAVHPENEEDYRKLLDAFLHTAWGDFFTREEME